MARSYRLEALVGVGAGSRVYQARRSDGAIVALKVMDDGLGEVVLARLRDEARILAVLRDPAFVRANPPTRVGGRWAVVMEYVPGETAYRLLRHGPFPPRVAVAVIAAVARALGAAWDAPGPQGAPLRLLHRDLKPGNLQILPDGTVKILDLGIARAHLPARESRTGALVPGTLGYIAPERRLGMEGLPAEVWSLGMVLRVLVTGEQPMRATGESPSLTAERAVVQLVGQMMRDDPEARLSMAEVTTAAGALAERLRGPTLAEWAPAHVRTQVGRDPRCGELWREEAEDTSLWDQLSAWWRR